MVRGGDHSLGPGFLVSLATGHEVILELLHEGQDRPRGRLAEGADRAALDVLCDVQQIIRILAAPAMKERILAMGGVPVTMSPAEFGAKAAEDSKRFGTIIREHKIVGD